MSERLKILVCANFAEYFREAAKGEFEDIEIVDYPAQCRLHKRDTSLLKGVLGQTVANAPEDTALLCGKLCPILETASESTPKVDVVCENICFSNIIGGQFVKYLLGNGAYLVTEPWLDKWDRYIGEMGFDQETASRYFREFASRLICVTGSTDQDVSGRLAEFASFLDLPFSFIESDRHLIRLLLQRLHSGWKLRIAERDLNGQLNYYRRQSADLLTVFEIIKSLSGVENVHSVLQTLKQALSMLFSCERVDLLLVDRETFETVLSDIHRDFLKDRFQKQMVLEKGSGFLVKIEHSGKTLGIIDVRNFRFPQHLDQYLGFSLNISAVTGLAYANARKMEIIRRNEAQLEHANSFDSLTGLYNRRRFEREIDRLSRTSPPTDVCLVMCDLDGLKLINDNLGHAQGDLAIFGTAEILRSCMRENDIIARLGGDEFAALMIECSQDIVDSLKERLDRSLEKFNLGNPDLQIDFSLGFSPVFSSSQNFQEMLKQADDRMYQEKRKKKGFKGK